VGFGEAMIFWVARAGLFLGRDCSRWLRLRIEEADENALFTGARTTGYFIARIDLDGRIHLLFSPCASPDGRHLAFSQPSGETNAWLLENF
jgi:hypothetical protein